MRSPPIRVAPARPAATLVVSLLPLVWAVVTWGQATRPTTDSTAPATAEVAAVAPTKPGTAEPRTALVGGRRPIPAVTHVVVISIDGCRPDLLLRGDTPVLHAMFARGSFTFWARTTAESVTLPSHVSMLTGVQPTKHGIQWNADLPLASPVYPAYPTLFALAHRAGYTTAMAAGKSKFAALAVPGSLDHCFLPDTATMDNDGVTDAAVGFVRRYQPGVLFVHLPETDNAGHAFGWASPRQMAALHDADACVGRITAALADAGLAGSTVVIVTADHGGAGRGHGPDDPRSRHIPWIAAGPGIRAGLDLTTYGDLQIDTEDTFATACYLLGIPVPRKVEGKPITQIVDRAELLGG